MSLTLVSSFIKQLIVMMKITITVLYDQSSLMLVLKTSAPWPCGSEG